MLDLLKDESYKVDSRFLETACGNGGFLVAILERKLETVVKKHNANQDDFEKYVFIAVSSIYAIDIQEDNCEESRERMFSMITQVYEDNYPESLNETAENPFLDSVRHVLNVNIILGGRLTGLRVDGSGLEIVFSEYAFEGENLIRKDFVMNDMISHEERKKTNEKVAKTGLFGMVENKKVEEELQPRKTVIYDNFKEVINIE